MGAWPGVGLRFLGAGRGRSGRLSPRLGSPAAGSSLLGYLLQGLRVGVLAGNPGADGGWRASSGKGGDAEHARGCQAGVALGAGRGGGQGGASRPWEPQTLAFEGGEGVGPGLGPHPGTSATSGWTTFPLPTPTLSFPLSPRLPSPALENASKVWKVGWMPTHCPGREEAVLPGVWGERVSAAPPPVTLFLELSPGRGILGYGACPRSDKRSLGWSCQGISLGQGHSPIWQHPKAGIPLTLFLL